MRLCNDLVRQHISPSFILTFFTGVLNNVVFENPLLTKYNDKSALVVVMELADGDLKQWSKTPKKEREWISVMFQILFGIIAYQTRFSISHNDLHWGNILFKTVKPPHPNSFWRYKYKGNTYLVPIVETVCMITDFGFVTRINNDNEMKDIRRISHIADWTRTQYRHENIFLEHFKRIMRRVQNMRDAVTKTAHLLPSVKDLEEYLIMDSFDLDTPIT
jgi:hypothetical protein